MSLLCNHEIPILYVSEDSTEGRRGEKIVSQYFSRISSIYYTNHWSGSDPGKRDQLRSRIARYQYELIICYKADLVLLKSKLLKAVRGAINIHPAPPEHPGLGMYVFPALYPDRRCFGGVTVHQLTSEIDRGPIYECVRFPIPTGMSVSEIRDLTSAHAEEVLDRTMQKLLAHQNGVGSPLVPKPIEWGSKYYSRSDEVRMMNLYQSSNSEQHVSTNATNGHDHLDGFGALQGPCR
jgi:methionyl-tRNA formyltransferase